LAGGDPVIADDDELPAVALRVIGEYRAERRMPPAAFDRVQRRLLRPAAFLGRLAVTVAAAAAITVLALVALSDRRSAVGAAAGDPSQAADAVRSMAPGESVAPKRAPDPVAAELPAELAPAHESIALPVQHPTRGAPALGASPAPAPRPSLTPPPSTLAAEGALLVRAQRALADDADDRVEAIVRQHARDFPNGELRPEFAALEAMLRCRDPGQSPVAVLRAFSTTHANSPVIAAVRQVCTPP
jgi:hypothetical protein